MTNMAYFMYSYHDTDCSCCKNTSFNGGCGYCSECKCNLSNDLYRGCYCVLEHEEGVEACPYYEEVDDA